MFRWLKDRTRRGRKASADTPREVDDYGFKQKYSPPPKTVLDVQEPFLALSGSVGAAVGWEEYKRDLPPTPADITASCIVMDDDIRSVHIYEEIPDLPFRCTPEGELRFGLAREEALRRLGFSPSNGNFIPASYPSHTAVSGTARNISPYMVVPLELRQGDATPEEFRMIFGHAEHHFGHVTGHDEGRGSVCLTPSMTPSLTPSMAPSSPSCGSSVFGSPQDVLGHVRAGSEECRGDISDRLLSAINLTRLLAAVRLSSSSADTCTTSPITIGMDRDGQNISVSVSVTPTNHHHNHVSAGSNGQGDPASVILHDHQRLHVDGSAVGEADILHDQRLHVDGSAVGEADTCLVDSSTVATSTLCPKLEPWSVSDCGQQGIVSRSESSHVVHCEVALNSASGCPASSQPLFTSKQTEAAKTDLASTSTDHSTTGMFQDSSFVSQTGFAHTGLRFLPSPQEQSALSEILHLKPGEKAELDPATIDALILRLYSHTLQIHPAQLCGVGTMGGAASLQWAELEAVEKMLKDMVRASEAEMDEAEGGRQSGAWNGAQLSPGIRRAENSDTGYEYDVSTASSEVSDQTSYDYFLSKAARTRSLECEVKKLITESCCSDSDVGGDDGRTLRAVGQDGKESQAVAVGGMSSLSLLSNTATPINAFTRRRSALRLLRSLSASDVVPTGASNSTKTAANTSSTLGDHANTSSTLADSDDGTMADLSESENSSGYYEPLPSARAPRAPPSARAPRAPPLSSSSSSTCTTRGRRLKGTVMGVGGLRQRGAGVVPGKEPLDVLDVPCFELRCTCPQSDRTLHAAGCRLGAVAAYTPRSKKSRRHDRPRNDHGHHHSRKSRKKLQHPKAGKAEVQHQGRSVSLKVRSSSGDRVSLPLTPLAVSGCRRASADAASSRMYSSLELRPSSSSGSSLTHTSRKDISVSPSTSSSCLYDKAAALSPAVTLPPRHAARSGSGKGGVGGSRNRLMGGHTAKSCTSGPGNGYTSRGARLSLSASSMTSLAAGGTSCQNLERADASCKDNTNSSAYCRAGNSEVYSIPAALPPDHPAGSRGSKGSGTVPTKLSLARGSVPDSSEVYGTRASLLQTSGSRPVSNRLLNDVIMANYNNM